MRTDTASTAVVADRSIDETDALDVLGGNERGVVAAMESRALPDWIRRVHERTTWTTSA
ncbi:hypothetical protein [Saccharothrix texasensis]|uniref:hypothetical protein n=1 Tax=Saccharothrix texasensis TaxID=103734 RepID=UPI001FE9B636|nr:hypothetical protein [Saccharothrix texasensis]